MNNYMKPMRLKFSAYHMLHCNGINKCPTKFLLSVFLSFPKLNKLFLELALYGLKMKD
jgi:hypothetical protein